MAKYTIYPGKFPCHTCKVEVKTVRVYPETKEITWMCPDKHVSIVNLNTKKKAKDFE